MLIWCKKKKKENGIEMENNDELIFEKIREFNSVQGQGVREDEYFTLLRTCCKTLKFLFAAIVAYLAMYME
jgi:hypothetical protein